MSLERHGGIHLGERVDIPDHLEPQRLYLRRWILLRTPWFSLYLHVIHMPDRDRHLHDHPWSFLSLVLWGGYDEMIGRPTPYLPTAGFLKRRRWMSLGWRPSTTRHAILRLHRTPTWTLVATGPTVRRWGFWTDEGFVDHEEYFTRHPASPEALRAAGGRFVPPEMARQRPSTPIYERPREP